MEKTKIRYARRFCFVSRFWQFQMFILVKVVHTTFKCLHSFKDFQTPKVVNFQSSIFSGDPFLFIFSISIYKIMLRLERFKQFHFFQSRPFWKLRICREYLHIHFEIDMNLLFRFERFWQFQMFKVVRFESLKLSENTYIPVLEPIYSLLWN